MTTTSYVELTNSSLFLYRQIHPKWIVNSRVTSLAFKPSKNHNYELSVSSSEKTTAAQAFDFHTKTLSKESVGVFGVTVEEVIQVELKTYESPKMDVPQDLAHCHIDFTDKLTNSQLQNKADKLVSNARDRGQLHP